MGRDNFVAPTANGKRQPTPDILGAVMTDTGKPVDVPAGKINTTGGTQMRAGLDDATVFEYGQAMITADGWGTFPAVIAYHDGKDYWLADGFHRVAAFLESFPDPKRKIPVEVRAGTRRDAVLHAAGANANHGLRRTNQDKRRAVETLLRDEEWAGWPDKDIAKACNVSREYVVRVRADIQPKLSSDRSQDTPRTVTRNGTTYTQNTANIGSKPPPVLNTPAPHEVPPLPIPNMALDDLPVIDSVTVPVRTWAEIDAAIDEEIELAKTHFRNGIETRRPEDEEITHPLDCYDNPDEETDAAILERLKWPMKMRDLHELKMWLKATRDEKAREYTKFTGWPAPTGLISSIDTMLIALEQAMDTTEQEAVADANQ